MSTVAGNNYGGIVRNGLILHVDAAKQDSYPRMGTTWNDLSGNNLAGALTNTPTYNSSNGGIIIFDGINESINFPNSALLKSANITVSAWVKSNELNRDNVLFDGGYYNSIAGYLLYVNASNQFQFWIRNSNNNTQGVGVRTATSTTVFNTSNWYNVTGIFDGSNVYIYVNGILENTAAMTNPITYTSSINFWIGNYASSPNIGLAYKGNVATTKIYNRALSASEILQNYNALKGRFGL